jgi:hypothetical protein
MPARVQLRARARGYSCSQHGDCDRIRWEPCLSEIMDVQHAFCAGTQRCSCSAGVRACLRSVPAGPRVCATPPLVVVGWLVALFHLLLTGIPEAMTPCTQGIPCRG